MAVGSSTGAEVLEPRTLRAVAPAPSPAVDATPTISVVIDYSLDTNNFFDTPQKRDLLRQAADAVVGWFKDSLAGIDPGGGDTWEAVFDHPATGARHTVRNPTVPANQVLLYAGGRDMSDALGRGGPGGYNATGSSGWLDRVARRGEGPATGSPPDFGPWGGAITFDTNPSSPWHFGATTDGLSGRNDFLSVASHEVAHLLGFGTSAAWSQYVSGGTFQGPAALTQYGTGSAAGVPLDGDPSHWAEGTQDAGGQEVAMDPQLTVGRRRLLTPLDFAALDDVGWSMPPRAALSAAPVNAAGAQAKTFTVAYSHYAPIDVDTFDGGDVTVIGPDGVVRPAAFVSASGTGTAPRVATYSVAPPGGAWDPADTGTYSVVLADNQVRGTAGEAVAAGTLGTFVADVAAPPAAQLEAPAAPTPGAAVYTFAVVYTDSVGVDTSSIDAGDVVVTGPGGSALGAATSAVPDPASPATSVTVTYTVPAPGGSWGPEDDGDYAIALRAGEVRDTSGNAAAGGTLGSFEVSLGAVRFDAATPATYTDASGDVVVVSLRGPGSGVVRFSGARPSDASAIDLAATTAASSLLIRTGPAGTTTGDVTVHGSLKGITGKTADLNGALTVAGSLGKLLLRKAGGAGGAAGTGSVVTLGAGPAATLTFAAVSELVIVSDSPIKVLRVANWSDADAVRDAVLAPAVGSIVSRGDFAADVTAASVGSIKAAGALSGSDVRASAAVGRVTAFSVRESRIFAGVADAVAGLPDSAGDFANPSATLAGVSVKSKLADAFSNALVAAPSVGRLSLGSIRTGNGGTPFGVAADRLAALTGVAVGGAGLLRQSRLDDPSGSLADGDFVVRLI